MDARGLLVLAGVAVAAWLQGPLGESNVERRRNDFRYTPDPTVVRLVAGAHRSTTADALWLRTLPDMSREFADPALKARWIHNVLESVTDLEPAFWTAYDFGQAYLTILDRRTPGAADRAVALLEKGIRRNPDAVGLYVRLAMIHWVEKKDRARTIEILRRAATLPGIDELSLRMLASLEAEGREDLLAIAAWADIAESKSPELRRVGELNLRRVKEQIALRALREFTAKNGRPPASIGDLRDPALIQAEVVDLVLRDLELTPEGKIVDRRLVELESEEVVRAVEQWARTWHDEKGGWPTLEDAATVGLRLPPAPAGRRWRFEGGRLTAVPE